MMWLILHDPCSTFCFKGFGRRMIYKYGIDEYCIVTYPYGTDALLYFPIFES